MLYSPRGPWSMLRAALAALALAGLCAMSLGCSQDDPRWRILTLVGDQEPILARDDASGAVLQLFPREGNRIKVELAEGLHPLPGGGTQNVRTLKRR